MDLGSILLLLALALGVGWFISRPLLAEQAEVAESVLTESAQREVNGEWSRLLAERDRLLSALQELDFDHLLGKIPAEDYPRQRRELLVAGATVLRRLDELGRASTAEAELAEAELAEAELAEAKEGALSDAELEELIQAHRRARSQSQREGAATAAAGSERPGLFTGFCPKCGKPAQKVDRFCSRCGTAL